MVIEEKLTRRPKSRNEGAVSPLRYPGGKSKVRHCVLDKAPKKYSEYREPFVGGGGVFFGVPEDKTRWINDIDPHLIAFYRELSRNPDKFVRDCLQIEPAKPGEELVPAKPGGKPLYNKRLKTQFDWFLNCDDPDLQGLKYFFINRTVWGGRVNYDMPSRLYFSVPEGWNIVKDGGKRLLRAAQCLSGVKATCGDYAELLSAPGESVWVYCDPPYVVNTNLSSSSQLYKHNFDEADHARLAGEIAKSPHMVCLSYDDCEMVRDLYPEPRFTIYKESWKYSGTSSKRYGPSGLLRGKREGPELLILNYTK